VQYPKKSLEDKHPTMVKATDKQWDTANSLYIARRLQEIAGGRRIAVLDMGCGDGKILEYLLDYGYDLYGYDLASSNEALKKRLGPYFGDSYDEHLKITPSDRTIPFDDNSFDVVYSNQVFEHVRFFEKMMSECARVLKPGGILLANFPLATYPIEGHLRVPFAHWIPPGRFRVKYLQLCYASGLFKKMRRENADRKESRSALEMAIFLDRYLRESTYYRFINEIDAVSKYYFEACELETGAHVRAKIDLLLAGKGAGGANFGAFVRLIDGGTFHALITYLLNAAFCMRNPKKGLYL
jgi:SAM-dependent methyltransferase